MSNWTEERCDFLRANWEHMLAHDIATQLGIPKKAVIGKARRLGLPSLKQARNARKSEGQRRRWNAMSASDRKAIGVAVSLGHARNKRMRK